MKKWNETHSSLGTWVGRPLRAASDLDQSHLGLCTLLAAMLPGDVVVTAQWLSRNRLHTAGMADKGHVGGVATRCVPVGPHSLPERC